MVIDFHTHILPGIDDGSSSVEESIAMLKREASQGVRRVIATPHFYAQHDSPDRFLERRRNAYRRLREAMAEYEERYRIGAEDEMSSRGAGESGTVRQKNGTNVFPKINIGAEVYFFPGISESDILPQLTIGGKRCILLEMPHSPWTERMYQEVEDIKVKRGLTPIIAHVDRYISPFKTYGIPERLEELPVYVQANARFFLHRSTKHMALRMLEEGRIHLLGSDCHNMETRLPNLEAALTVIEEKLGMTAIHQINLHERRLIRET